MESQTDAQLREILSLETVAAVGCSPSPDADAHEVPAYLIEHGYDVIPVTGAAEEVHGRRTYPSLSDVDREVDIVDVLRTLGGIGEIVDEAVERGDVSVIWTQRGIRDDAAAERARDAGLVVVQDRCMAIEHRRLFG